MNSADDYQVEVISDDSGENYRKRLNADSTCSLSNRDGEPQDAFVFKLPTEGTGMYKVNLYKELEGTMTFVYTFDLYVLSKVLAVEAAIIVGSESTS